MFTLGHATPKQIAKESTGQTVADVVNFGKDSNVQKFNTTFYQYDGKKIPMLHEHNFSRLAQNVLKMNELNSYVSIVLFGKSGSGKSTLTTSLIHRISCKQDTKYIVRWFERDDITNMDKIIDGLPKGLRYILVFDDVSYVLDQVSSKRKKELAGKLTHIRHDLGKGSKVITIMNVHFMTALMPIFRDSNFKIITSMSDQDGKNFKNVLGWDNKYAIDRFQRQYESQMLKGYFYLNNVGGTGKSYSYQTNSPFRLVQVSGDAGRIHPVLVPQESCKHCTAKRESPKQKLDARVFYDDCVKAYSTRAKTAMGYWNYFIKGNPNALPANSIRAINWINKTVGKYDIDDEKLSEIIQGEIKRDKRKKNNTQKYKLQSIQREKQVVEKSGILDSGISKIVEDVT